MKLWWIPPEYQVTNSIEYQGKDLEKKTVELESKIDDNTYKTVIKEVPITVVNLESRLDYAIYSYQHCLDQLECYRSKKLKEISNSRITSSVVLQKQINGDRSYVIEGVNRVKNECESSLAKIRNLNTEQASVELIQKKKRIGEDIQKLENAIRSKEFKPVKHLLSLSLNYDADPYKFKIAWEGKEESIASISSSTENKLKLALYQPIVQKHKDNNAQQPIRSDSKPTTKADNNSPIHNESLLSKPIACYAVKIGDIGNYYMSVSIPQYLFQKKIIASSLPTNGIGICLCGNEVYISGGEINEQAMPNAYRLQCENILCKAIEIQKMQVAKTQHTMISYNKYIFTLGGCRQEDAKHTFLNTFEKLNVVNGDSWEKLAPLTKERKGIAAVCVNGDIYAIGGSSSRLINVIEKYNIDDSKQWQELHVQGNMQNVAFAGAAMIDYQTVLIFGGYRGEINNSGDSYLFDIASGRVRPAAKIAKQFIESSLITMMPVLADNKLYMLSEQHNGVHIYDIMKNQWNFFQN